MKWRTEHVGACLPNQHNQAAGPARVRGLCENRLAVDASADLPGVRRYFCVAVHRIAVPANTNIELELRTGVNQISHFRIFPLSAHSGADKNVSPPMEHDFLREGLTAMSAGASTLTGWTLAILGATVVGIVSSEFLRPGGRIRYAYLIFIPGWFLLGFSIFYGEKVMRRFVAAAFTENRSTLVAIGNGMNSDYSQQRLFFQLALFAFGTWLISLLLWWVFAQDKVAQQGKL